MAKKNEPIVYCRECDVSYDEQRQRDLDLISDVCPNCGREILEPLPNYKNTKHYKEAKKMPGFSEKQYREMVTG